MLKVSVIIPAYNAMTYLSETVESVLRQTFTDFELLIIDDGSSDETVEWVSQITDSRVKLISQINQGPSGARNTGIAHAQGEYIAFLDADDLWEPTKLEKQVHSLDADLAVGLVSTWAINIDEQGNAMGKVVTLNLKRDVWKQIVEANIIHCGSVPMVRRCCFQTVGVFDQNLRSVEDWDMWIRIASYYAFAVVKEPLVSYRQHSSNSSKNYQLMMQNLAKVIEKTFQSVSSEFLYLKSRAFGRASLYVAWRCLEVNDYERLCYYAAQASTYYPQLRYSQGYVRLSLISTGKRLLSDHAYSDLRNLVHFFIEKT